MRGVQARQRSCLHTSLPSCASGCPRLDATSRPTHTRTPQAVAAAGIKVARVPTYSPTSVAEHAVAHMFALNRCGHWRAPVELGAGTGAHQARRCPKRGAGAGAGRAAPPRVRRCPAAPACASRTRACHLLPPAARPHGRLRALACPARAQEHRQRAPAHDAGQLLAQRPRGV